MTARTQILSRFLKRDQWFVAALFMLWTIMLLALHSGHPYLSLSLPSIDFSTGRLATFHQAATLQNSIAQLRDALSTETRPEEIPHVIHNLGVSYYDLYKTTRQRAYLDSAISYVQLSLRRKAGIARFHYNFGRMLTEVGNHSAAEAQYEQAVAIDPRHVLALHNLGLVTYFERHDPDKAQGYLERALVVDSTLPICNYVLGEIAMDKKEFPLAADRFRHEVVGGEAIARAPRDLPADLSNIMYASAMSHLELATLFSTTFVSRDSAQAHLNAYLLLEADPARQKEAIEKMKKYWQMK